MIYTYSQTEYRAENGIEKEKVPALVGEADRPGVFRLASVLLLRRLLPLGDNVTDLRGTRVSFRTQTLAVCRGPASRKGAP